MKINGHYDAKKNVTKVEEKMKDGEGKGEKEDKKILSGLAVVSLATEKGNINVSY